MIIPSLIPLLIRPLKGELLFLIPVLIGIWFIAGILSIDHRYSAFYRPNPNKLFREHDMYRETAMEAWKDLQSYAQSNNIKGLLFDKGDDICVGVLSIARTRAYGKKIFDLPGDVTDYSLELE